MKGFQAWKPNYLHKEERKLDQFLRPPLPQEARCFSGRTRENQLPKMSSRRRGGPRAGL